MEEHSRKSDATIDHIRQMLEDHISSQNAWNKAHDEKSEIWRDKIDARFAPLEDFVKNVSWSWKLLLGFAATVGSSIKIFSFIHSHFKWG